MRAAWLVLMVAAGCKPKSPPTLADAGASDAPSAAGTATAVTSSELIAAANANQSFDAPMTRKRGDGLSVTFVEGTTQQKTSYALFLIDSDSDDEHPISSVLSVQATLVEGLTGTVDALRSKCDGIVPPHGRLGCVVKHDFEHRLSGNLRYRVAGVWFHVQLPSSEAGAAPPAGTKSAR